MVYHCIQVMIPSRVQHPCIMPVQAVFADAINACVHEVLLCTHMPQHSRTNATVTSVGRRHRLGGRQVHPDAVVQRWRHEGMA